MTTFWLVVVVEDVEIEILGPFATDAVRDCAARTYRDADDSELPDGIHWMNVVDGVPEAGDYSGGFFEDQPLLTSHGEYERHDDTQGPSPQ